MVAASFFSVPAQVPVLPAFHMPPSQDFTCQILKSVLLPIRVKVKEGHRAASRVNRRVSNGKEVSL